MSRVLWVSEILLFLTGAALMVVFSTVTSLIQLIAPNEMRGRVMSIYMVAFRGGMPLGSLVSGYLATFIGAPMVIGINGVLLVVVAAVFPRAQPRGPGSVKTGAARCLRLARAKPTPFTHGHYARRRDDERWRGGA